MSKITVPPDVVLVGDAAPTARWNPYKMMEIARRMAIPTRGLDERTRSVLTFEDGSTKNFGAIFANRRTGH